MRAKARKDAWMRGVYLALRVWRDPGARWIGKNRDLPLVLEFAKLSFVSWPFSYKQGGRMFHDLTETQVHLQVGTG